ncbi:MAG: YihY/virulence factor BrkB family protein [Planctomycetota bacterium]
MRALFTRLKTFFLEGLWKEDLRECSTWRLLGHGLLRVVIHVVYGFSRNLGGIQAAGLTMLTVMAIVPLLAIGLGIADALGFHDTLEQGIAAAVQQMIPSSDALIWEVRHAVQRVNFEALGMLGSLVLLYTGYVLFTNVEQSLNRVWELRRSRRWYRRIVQFVIVVLVVPVLGLAAIFLGTALHEGPWIYYLREHLSWLADLYSLALDLVPHVLLWIAFAALYKFMPATTVPWRGALVGGVVAGSGWLFLHELYLYFQVGVALWNKIYASFLALPLLLIYLQAAWSAVLVGAEFSYAVLHIHEMKAPWDAVKEGGV